MSSCPQYVSVVHCPTRTHSSFKERHKEIKVFWKLKDKSSTVLHEYFGNQRRSCCYGDETRGVLKLQSGKQSDVSRKRGLSKTQ